MDDYKDTYTSNHVVFGAQGEIHQLCTANPKRVALMMNAVGSAALAATDQVVLRADNNPAGVGGGYVMFNGPALLFSRKLHGALATSAWFAAITGVSELINITEVFEP